MDSLLSPFLDWHRAEELPKYLQIFKDFEGLLDDEIMPADLERLEDEIEHAWVRLERRSLDWLINLATILSAKQVEDFFQKLKTQQNKYEKKYLPMNSGEVIFLHSHVLHGSDDNNSKDKWRRAFLCGYLREDAHFNSGGQMKRVGLSF